MGPNPPLQPYQPQPSNNPPHCRLGSPYLPHTFSLLWSCSCWTQTTFIHYPLPLCQVFSQTAGPSKSLGWWPHLEGVSLLSLNLTNTSPALFIFASYYVLPVEWGISQEWRFLEGKFYVWFFFIITHITYHWIFTKKYWLIEWMSKGLKILYNFIIFSGIFSHLILIIILWDKYNYSEENSESERQWLRWKTEVRDIGY